MSDVPWDQLPGDTREVCWRTEHGWSKKTPHCGKKASWIKRDTCGCGACDMTIMLCDECYRAWITARKRVEEWGKRNVVHETLPGVLTKARRRKDVKDN